MIPRLRMFQENEHDQLIRTQARLKITEELLNVQREIYRNLFNFFNVKHPDEVTEWLNQEREKANEQKDF